ncbi:MAG: response regulator [Bryobacteraceae bacterium]|nr:response regulator [Bryobacteraceae bacterium]
MAQTHMIDSAVGRLLVVVEDNETDVFLLRMALREQGIEDEPVTLEDGEAALNYLGGLETQPALIVLDLNLPKRDGLEVLSALRRMPALASAPVMILTSSTSPHERRRAEALGVAAYVHKPNDLDAFLGVGRIVAGLIGTGETQRAAVESN